MKTLRIPVWAFTLLLCGSIPLAAQAPPAPETQPAAPASQPEVVEVPLRIENPGKHPLAGVPVVFRVGELNLPPGTGTVGAQLVTTDPASGDRIRVPFQIDDIDGDRRLSAEDHLVFLAIVPAGGARDYLLRFPDRLGGWLGGVEPAFQVAATNERIAIRGPDHLYRLRKQYRTYASLVLAGAETRDGQPWVSTPFPARENWGDRQHIEALGWAKWTRLFDPPDGRDVDVTVVANGPVRVLVRATYRSPFGLFQTNRYLSVYARVGRVDFTDITSLADMRFPRVGLERRLVTAFHGEGEGGLGRVGLPGDTIRMQPIPADGAKARYLVLDGAGQPESLVVAAGSGSTGQVHLTSRPERGIARRVLSVAAPTTALEPFRIQRLGYTLCYRRDVRVHPDSLVPPDLLTVQINDRRVALDPSPRWTWITALKAKPSGKSGDRAEVEVRMQGAGTAPIVGAVRYRVLERPHPSEARIREAGHRPRVSMGRQPLTRGVAQLKLRLPTAMTTASAVLDLRLGAGAWTEHWVLPLPVQPALTMRLVPEGPAAFAQFGDETVLMATVENPGGQARNDLVVEIRLADLHSGKAIGEPLSFRVPPLEPWSTASVTVAVPMKQPVYLADVRLGRRAFDGKMAGWPLARRRIILGMTPEDYRNLLTSQYMRTQPWRAAGGLKTDAGRFLLALSPGAAFVLDPAKSPKRFGRLARMGFDCLALPLAEELDAPGAVAGIDADRVPDRLAGAGLSAWLTTTGRGIAPILTGPGPDVPAWPSAAAPGQSDRGLVFANALSAGMADLANPRTVLNLHARLQAVQAGYRHVATRFGGRRLVGSLNGWSAWGPPIWLPKYEPQQDAHRARPILDWKKTLEHAPAKGVFRASNVAGHGPYAESAFRAWVATHYGDDSPSLDSNKDGRTFNLESGEKLKHWTDLTLPSLQDRVSRGQAFYLWMRYREQAVADLERLAEGTEWSLLGGAGSDPHRMDAAGQLRGLALVHALDRRILTFRPADAGGAWTAIGAINRALRADRRRTAVALAGGRPQQVRVLAGDLGASVRRWVDAFGRVARMRGMVLERWDPTTAFDHEALETMVWLSRFVEAQPGFWEGVRAEPPEVAVYWPRESMLAEAQFDRCPDGTWAVDPRSRLDHWGPTALAQAGVHFDTLFTEDLVADGLKPYRVLYMFFGARIPAPALKAIRDWHQTGGAVFACYDALQGDMKGRSLDTFERIFGAIPSLTHQTRIMWDAQRPGTLAPEFFVRFRQRYRIVAAHNALPVKGTWMTSTNGLSTFRPTRPGTEVLAINADGFPCAVGRLRSMIIGSRLGLDVAAQAPAWLKTPALPAQAAAQPIPEDKFNNLVKMVAGFAEQVGPKAPIRVRQEMRRVYNVFAGTHYNPNRDIRLVYLTEHAGRGGDYTIVLPPFPGELNVYDLRTGTLLAERVRSGFQITLVPYDIKVLAVGPAWAVAPLAARTAALVAESNFFLLDNLNRMFFFGITGQGDRPQRPVMPEGRTLGIICVGDRPTPEEHQFADQVKRLVQWRANDLYEPEMPGAMNLRPDDRTWLKLADIPVVPASQMTEDMWKRHNVLLVGTPKTNAAVKALVDSGVLSNADGDSVRTYRPNPYRDGGNAIVVYIRDPAELRRLRRQLREHIALWF